MANCQFVLKENKDYGDEEIKREKRKTKELAISP